MNRACFLKNANLHENIDMRAPSNLLKSNYLRMKNIVIGAFLLCSFACFSQKPDSVKSEGWKKIYRASATKINDLVHTKLDVSFDFSKSWMYGKAWLTLHPHFYATDSLNLDAKSMNINEVSIIKAGKHIPLKYGYDSLNLRLAFEEVTGQDLNWFWNQWYYGRVYIFSFSDYSRISGAQIKIRVCI